MSVLILCRLLFSQVPGNSLRFPNNISQQKSFQSNKKFLLYQMTTHQMILLICRKLHRNSYLNLHVGLHPRFMNPMRSVFSFRTSCYRYSSSHFTVPEFKYARRTKNYDDSSRMVKSFVPIKTRPERTENDDDSSRIVKSSVPIKTGPTSQGVSPSDDLLENEEKYMEDTGLYLKSGKKPRRKGGLQGFKARGEILFGFHPVLIALQNDKRNIYTVFLKDMDFKGTRLNEIKDLALEKQIPVKFVDGPTLDTICDRPVHQGVCADASFMKVLQNSDISSCTVAEEDNKLPPVWLVLEKVVDPMNFGAILRCAYYFGVDRILWCQRNNCKLTPTVSKASAGVMEIVDLYALDDLAAFLKEQQEKGWQVLGTCGSQSTQPALDVKSIHVTRPTIVLVGNEGTGLDGALRECCDHLISVHPNQPLTHAVDSLNVGVATGIILFQLLSSRCTMKT